MLIGRRSKISRGGVQEAMTALCRNCCSSMRCVRTLAPSIEHETPDISQFAFDIFVRQSGYAAQSGDAQGEFAEDMSCDSSCTGKPESGAGSDTSLAETGSTGHSKDKATRLSSAVCENGLLTLNL